MVKIKNLVTPKIADRGIQCMFVGYALNHSPDMYWMYNPKTNGIMVSHDVIWL